MKEHLDGWDLGILIRMGYANGIKHPLYHSMVRGELISEVGWMDQEEIDMRLERLKELDLIKDVAQAIEPAYWVDENWKEKVHEVIEKCPICGEIRVYCVCERWEDLLEIKKDERIEVVASYGGCEG